MKGEGEGSKKRVREMEGDKDTGRKGLEEGRRRGRTRRESGRQGRGRKTKRVEEIGKNKEWRKGEGEWRRRE